MDTVRYLTNRYWSVLELAYNWLTDTISLAAMPIIVNSKNNVSHMSSSYHINTNDHMWTVVFQYKVVIVLHI